MTTNADPIDKPTTILLCRHGETPWNIERRIQGQHSAAPGLTELGHRQAQRLAGRLATAGVDVLVSSDLTRALETARHVAQTVSREPQLDWRWREMNLGRWQGLTFEEVNEQWPDEVAALKLGEDNPRGGGDTSAGFRARSVAAMHDLAQQHRGQTVAVITHGGNVRACLLAAGIIDKERSSEAVIHNASLTIIQIDDGRLWASTICDTAHLAGLDGTPAVDSEASDERS